MPLILIVHVYYECTFLKVTVCNNKGDKWFEVTYVEDNVYTIDEITGKRNEERNRSRFLISVKNIIDGKVMEVGKTEREPFEAEEKEGSPVVIPGGFREVRFFNYKVYCSYI